MSGNDYEAIRVLFREEDDDLEPRVFVDISLVLAIYFAGVSTCQLELDILFSSHGLQCCSLSLLWRLYHSEHVQLRPRGSVGAYCTMGEIHMSMSMLTRTMCTNHDHSPASCKIDMTIFASG